jgi:hypothetical protein
MLWQKAILASKIENMNRTVLVISECKLSENRAWLGEVKDAMFLVFQVGLFEMVI